MSSYSPNRLLNFVVLLLLQVTHFRSTLSVCSIKFERKNVRKPPLLLSSHLISGLTLYTNFIKDWEHLLLIKKGQLVLVWLRPRKSFLQSYNLGVNSTHSSMSLSVWLAQNRVEWSISWLYLLNQKQKIGKNEIHTHWPRVKYASSISLFGSKPSRMV